ncbi:MAG: ABC transporter ATP-binding protein [bacterium]
MDYAIEARNIEFAYPDAPAVLQGVDVGAAPREILGIIGPNGAGKTTLLNILAWSLRPTRGEVLLLGEPASSLTARERARRLAMVPQEPAVAFSFSVMEIVLMGRAPYLGRWQLEGRGDTDTANEALAMTGLVSLKNRSFHELSGGEKQRVMIAKALAQRSNVLLLDEPTSFLDLKHQVEIYQLVRELARQRDIAVIAVSHDINLAAMHCDRVAVLSGGRVIEQGPPATVVRPDLLSRVYGVEVAMASHELRSNAPLIFPVPGGEKSWKRDKP